MIHVADLSFTYPGANEPAVRGISFGVKEGETFGFLGPSGAGKSTTQNILIGLLSGWSGQVEVMGRPLSQWGHDYYRAVGVSFELPNHYLKLTARENLEFFRALYDFQTEPVDKVADQVGLGADLDKPVEAYSKGMKNRLNFARSLLHRPRLWFLDEPTSGLDPTTSARIRDIIRERSKQGITTVITTHDMHTADLLCDRVGFMVGGRLVLVASPSQLRQEYGREDVLVTWDDPPGERSFPLTELGTNADFLRTLKEHQVRSIHSQESTLEQVFIQVTGKALS